MFGKNNMILRKVHLSDASDIARLNGELGYAGDADTMRDRLERIVSQSDQVVLVAVVKETIVGWLQAHASLSLASGARVEILGLIVGEGCRHSGIGRALVRQVEGWALEIGSDVVVVRSNTKRVESHRFYSALGFSTAKTQAVYRKHLKKEPDQAIPASAATSPR